MADFVQFTNTFAKFEFMEGRLGATPALNVEIFLKTAHVLGTWVLSHSETPDATPTFSLLW